MVEEPEEELDDEDRMEMIHIETSLKKYNRAARAAARYLCMAEPILRSHSPLLWHA